MTTDNFCPYLQNRLNQTSQTGGQQYSDTFPSLVFPANSSQFFSPGAEYMKKVHRRDEEPTGRRCSRKTKSFR